MTLRRKTLLWLSATLIIVAATQAVYNYYLERSGNSKFEQKIISINTHRVSNAIQDELNFLHQLHYNYSAWDDAYRFIEKPDSNFLNSAMPPSTMIATKLSYIAFLNTNREIVLSYGINYHTGQRQNYRKLSAEYFTNYPQLTTFRDEHDANTGLLEVDGKLFMMVFGPIVKSDGTGPIRGTLVFGREIDENYDDSLTRKMQISVTLFNLSDRKARSIFSGSIGANLSQSDIHIDATHRDSLVGYRVLKDLFGNPVGLLKLRTPTEQQHLNGKGFLVSITNTLFIMTLLALFIWFFSRTILRRIEMLNDGVKLIGKKANPQMRVRIDGTDELGELGQNINEMLENVHRAQEYLQETERRFRGALANIRMIGVILDREGKIIYSNRYLQESTGWTETELLGRDWFETIVPEETRSSRRSDYTTRVQNDSFEALLVREIQTRRGDRRTIVFNMSALHDRLGSIESVSLIGEDITDRLMAEAEIRRLAMLVESATEAIEIADVNGDYIYVNPAFTKISGYYPEEVLGGKMRLAWSATDQNETNEKIWNTISSGAVWNGHLSDRRKEGGPLELDATIVPLRNPVGKVTHYGKFARDVTKQAELQRQLERAQRFVTVGELTGGIAHNFNNALTVIMGNIGLARIADRDQTMAFLADAESACIRASDLIKQLMMFSRRTQIEKRPVSIGQLLEEVVKLVRSTFDRRIEIELCEMPEMKHIGGDPSQLQQVLLNMCFNAKDALQEVSSDLERVLKISISASEMQISDLLIDAEIRNGDFVKITVEDTGCGMSQETLKRVFEPFFTTKDVGKGTGLGLSTAFGIIKQHDGWINVSSAPNVGTRFTIFIPVLKETLDSAKASIPKLEIPRGTERLLLVEDEELVRKVGCSLLERMGYTVETASNGLEALELLEPNPHRFALILLDISMPVMSGVEFMDRAIVQYPHLRIVVSSGVPLVNVDPKIATLVVGTVSKPYQPVELAQTIRQILDQ